MLAEFQITCLFLMGCGSCCASAIRVGPDTCPDDEAGDADVSDGRHPLFKVFVETAAIPQISHYRVLRRLGSGSSADVYLVEDTESEEYYAAKVYSTRGRQGGKRDESIVAAIEKEITIMRACSHPNIVPVFDVVSDSWTITLSVIITYAKKGSLLPPRFISDPISEERCQRVFAQLASAVCAMHTANVVHRDIKPENIFVLENDSVLLGDFSSATFVDPESDLVYGHEGTPLFYSPEECVGETFRGKPADIWSMGVSLYLMVFGHLPFGGGLSSDAYVSQLMSVFKSIQEDELKLDPSIPISADLENLLFKLLDKNSETRLTAEQVVDHPWVTQAN
jgi:[calcium/calmodulin-dependent protein kinase] kinase